MAPIKPGIETRNTRNNQLKQPNTSTPTNANNVSSISPIPRSSTEESLLKSLLVKHQLIVESNKEILLKVTEMENSLQFLSAKYEELKGMYVKVINENKTITQNNTEVMHENMRLQEEIHQINTEFNEMKQTNIKNKIVIFGVPNLKDHVSVKLTFNNILDALKVKREDIIIDDIFQKKTNTEQAPIFITFKNYPTKLNFLQIAKINKIIAHSIGFVNNNNKITMVDQLTETNRTLLREAKALLTHGFKFVWTRNGKVLCRKLENSEIIVLKNINHVQTLKSQNVTI